MLLPLAAVLAMLAPWASAIDREAAAAKIPRDVLAAIVVHESRGVASVVSPMALHCIGLTQICPRTMSACRDDLQAPACVAVKARLLDGAFNLHVGAGRLAQGVAFCRRKTGHARPEHVLATFAGVDGHGVVCGQRHGRNGWVDAPQHKIVADIMALAAQIRRGRR